MNPLKEGLRRRARVGIPLIASIFLTIGCGSPHVGVDSDLVDCDDPKRQSGMTSILLTPNGVDHVEVEGRKIESLHPGMIGPNNANSMQFSDNGVIFSISAKTAKANGDYGTNVTVEAECETDQAHPKVSI